MSVAFILPFLFRYQRGIERSCVHLANELSSLGQRVTLIAWGQREVRTDFQIDPRIRIVRLPYVRYYRSKWAVPFYVFELLRGRYDVVNVFFAGYGEAPALRIARALRSFQVNFIAGYPIEQVPHRFEEFKAHRLERLLDHVIVKSPAMAEGVAGFFNREVTVIPNGVDLEIFQPGIVEVGPLRRCLGLRPSDLVLLTVAALEERKGVQHVIRIMPELLETHPDVHYIVVGDGPDRERLTALTAELNVTGQVHFMGTEVDVIPYYQIADVFLLPSYGEGFPNVLLEAWAMGLPVVVSRCPPYTGIVPETVGRLIDPTDDEQLQSEIAGLLNSPESRTLMGELAREHVEREYSWPDVALKYQHIFLQPGTG